MGREHLLVRKLKERERGRGEHAGRVKRESEKIEKRSSNEELKGKWQEMTTADVRDMGVLSLSNIEEGVTKTDGGLQYMGAKNTENMTQASEEEKKKTQTSKLKMCIVSCLG